ncbi:MAG: CDP-glycerol glycerophosphotransferase family protein, partial [Methanobrevibacter sp.]|nr:CDP-glycerol glycerophosphotransferase family protein [Methanobrevibacter sp.]
IRTHYFISNNLDLSKFKDFAFDVSGYEDIAELYLISDILITDYSSVFFDYANLKRPILFYTYDLDKYSNLLRGFYLDIHNDVPGPLLFTTSEVIDAIENIDDVSRQYNEKYEEFYNRFCYIDDGNASKRIVEKIWGRNSH